MFSTLCSDIKDEGQRGKNEKTSGGVSHTSGILGLGDWDITNVCAIISPLLLLLYTPQVSKADFSLNSANNWAASRSQRQSSCWLGTLQIDINSYSIKKYLCKIS